MQLPTFIASYAVVFEKEDLDESQLNAVNREVYQAVWFADAIRELDDYFFDRIEFEFPTGQTRQSMFQSALQKIGSENAPEIQIASFPTHEP